MKRKDFFRTILSMAGITVIGMSVACGNSSKEQVKQDNSTDTELSEKSTENDSITEPMAEETKHVDEGNRTEDASNEPDGEADSKDENAELQIDAKQEKAEILTDDSVLDSYREYLKKIIKGQASLPGDGEALRFYDCPNPGYALYDIDKNGIPELFITNDIESSWRSYEVFRKEDIENGYGTSLNGYLPDSEMWVWGFDFVTRGYNYSADGFTTAFEVNYPVDDGEATTLAYSGEEPQNVSDDEITKLLSGQISVPEDLKWILLDKSSANIPVGSLEETDITVSGCDIESVDWTNDQEKYEFPAPGNTLFTFHMSDGSIQKIDAGYEPMITGMSRADIDNDGNDDYIINAYYPITDVSLIADNSSGAAQLIDDISNSKLIEVDDNVRLSTHLKFRQLIKMLGVFQRYTMLSLYIKMGNGRKVNVK